MVDDGSGNSAKKNVSVMRFYAYRLQVRERFTDDIVLDVLHFGGLLCQQIGVDQFVKMEEEKLMFVRTHQTQLKAAQYQGLTDAVAADGGREAGFYIVLPSSHPGSPRHNHQLYQDAMAVVRKLGKPDLFITFKCGQKFSTISRKGSKRGSVQTL